MPRRFRVWCTDPHWIEVLRSRSLHDNVNFWRGDQRRVRLPPGSHFYFWRRGTRHIVGRAVFRTQAAMSISEAWKTFGYGNGVLSCEELRRQAVDVLHLASDTLACLVLDEVRFLDEPYPPLPLTFKATNNPKDYREGSLPDIESRFT